VRRFRILVLLAALAPPIAAPADKAPPPDRGRDLYELRCTTCHATSVHGREKRVARDFEEVRAWVSRWNATLGLGWTRDDVDDVTLYLNATYYRYPCPPTVCKVVSLR
jgi:hypothetical protein